MYILYLLFSSANHHIDRFGSDVFIYAITNMDILVTQTFGVIY